MRYDLTEKLKFNEDPILVVKGTELTVHSDAESVLKLMDVLGSKGEVTGAVEAAELLFGGKDRKKLSDMKLKMDDYLLVIKAAIQLAMGVDPEEEPEGE